MKPKILILTLLFLLIISSGFLFKKVQLLKDIIYEQAQLDSVSRIKLFRQGQVAVLHGEKVTYRLPDAGKLFISDMAGISYPFAQLIDGKPRLVLRFTEFSCDACYIQQIQKLKSLAQIIGTNSIVLLVSFRSNSTLALLKNTHGFLFTIYNVDREALYDVPFEKHRMPYYFLLNDMGVCTNFHLLDKDLTELNEIYLERIESYFKGY